MASELIISNIWMLLFVAAWLLTIFFYQFKKRYIDAGSILLLSYFFYSVFSFVLFNSDYYKFNDLELFPFVYLYLMLIMAFWPVLKYDVSKIDEIQKPPNLYLNILISIYVISSIMQLPKILSDFTSSIVKLLLVSTGGQDLYNEAMADSYSLGDGAISNLPSIVSNAYGNFGILLFFYYLTLTKTRKIIVIGLFLSCLISLLSNISLGQRGPIAEILLSMIITYFALRKFLQPKVNRIISIVGIVLLVATIVPIIALTNSRFGESLGGSNSSVYFYLGQENLFFNNYGLDNGGIRYGDRTIPLFKRMLGFENVPNNFWERREKYPALNINDEVFIGFVGDFTLDFGPYIATLLFIIFTLFVTKSTKIRNGKILFHQLILIHFVISVCMLGGMKLYPFSDVGGNLQLIVYFLLYVFFRLDYEFRIKKEIGQLETFPNLIK